jgi:spore coat polysaccharide biosynthesis protein SpsF
MSESLRLAIIQGRMGSSRLPGKVLLEIAGKPMLQHVIERTRRASNLDALVVATSSEPADDPIAQFCDSKAVPCWRGSLHDVLDRYYQAAKAQQAGLVVRITADCPMIDPDLIDATVALVNNSGASCLPDGQPARIDFAANRLPPPFGRSFPIGLDVEACTFAALQRAWQESTETFHREHVMPYLYEGARLTPVSTSLAMGVSQRGFHIAQLQHQPNYGALRWTVDTPDDLEFARQIFARLADKPLFTWQDVLEVLRAEPGLARINSGVRHKTMTEVEERAKK